MDSRKLVEEAKKLFPANNRPGAFIRNPDHCCECAEHEETLREHDQDSIGIEQLGNAGWDPICFISPEGYKYYFPALVRLALNDSDNMDYIEQFLFRVVDPDGATIKDVAETSLRQVIGSRPIDDVLTDKKEDIQAETKILIQRLLDSYEAGIRIREVKLLNVFAPVQVQAAFDDVVKAKEDKARIINLADAYKEDILPRARGAAARLLEDAEAFRQERIALATGKAQRFIAILSQYRGSEDVTRQRLYLEAMEDILPGIKKVIVQNDADVIVLQGQGASTVVPLPSP